MSGYRPLDAGLAGDGGPQRQPKGFHDMPKSQTSSSSRSTARAKKTNAIALLKADHEKVEALFDRYEKQKEKMTPRQREQLAAEICGELKVHTQIEEEIFYPAAREACEDCEELLDEADVEHASAKQLIAEIEGGPKDEHFDARVKVLGEYVKHHVKEEQNELFPEVRKSELDLEELGEQMAARKQELMGGDADTPRVAAE